MSTRGQPDYHPRLYLAAPLFSEAELGFNVQVAALLGTHFEVFLPQRDGRLLSELTADGLAHREAAALVFSADLEALRESDVLLAVLDGRTVDEGVAFEIGVAYARGTPCIGFQTDPRRLLPTGNNPMIECALQQVIGGVAELRQWAESWARACTASLEGNLR